MHFCAYCCITHIAAGTYDLDLLGEELERHELEDHVGEMPSSFRRKRNALVPASVSSDGCNSFWRGHDYLTVSDKVSYTNTFYHYKLAHKRVIMIIVYNWVVLPQTKKV
ncbi:hypothetical protein AB6A40_009000 [Gnathostoma spinigerum]|uniref:Uncharacterized protein n=1 Tax=Gnathostoma spinigerum TaxID=75299 RepID=A0ABD6ESJ4_9BILA